MLYQRCFSYSAPSHERKLSGQNINTCQHNAIQFNTTANLNNKHLVQLNLSDRFYVGVVELDHIGLYKCSRWRGWSVFIMSMNSSGHVWFLFIPFWTGTHSYVCKYTRMTMGRYVIRNIVLKTWTSLVQWAKQDNFLRNEKLWRKYEGRMKRLVLPSKQQVAVMRIFSSSPAAVKHKLKTKKPEIG